VKGDKHIDGASSKSTVGSFETLSVLCQIAARSSVSIRGVLTAICPPYNLDFEWKTVFKLKRTHPSWTRRIHPAICCDVRGRRVTH